MAELYSKIEQEMECPKEIVIWNYWDHEHIVGTHYKHYSKIKIFHENDNWSLTDRYVKLPYIPFEVNTRNFSYLESPNIMRSFHIGKVGVLEQEFHFKDLPNDHCLVTLSSRMEVPSWAKFLFQRYFEKLTVKWFYATWDEDHPMRLRRWKVWNMGFNNFKGIDYINNKTRPPKKVGGNGSRPYPVELPIKKSTKIGSEGYSRPFSKSVEVGYSMPDML